MPYAYFELPTFKLVNMKPIHLQLMGISPTPGTLAALFPCWTKIFKAKKYQGWSNLLIFERFKTR